MEQYFQGKEESTRKEGYNVWKETERAEIGRYASEHGVAKAVHCYEKKLEGKVPETTVHRFKNLYREALKRKLDDTTDGEVHTIPKKPRGQPTLLPSELDSRVQVYVSSVLYKCMFYH